MSQKSNLQTIRPFLRGLNLVNLSRTEFLDSLNFIKFFQSFFNKKFLRLLVEIRFPPNLDLDLLIINSKTFDDCC